MLHDLSKCFVNKIVFQMGGVGGGERKSRFFRFQSPSDVENFVPWKVIVKQIFLVENTLYAFSGVVHRTILLQLVEVEEMRTNHSSKPNASQVRIKTLLTRNKIICYVRFRCSLAGIRKGAGVSLRGMGCGNASKLKIFTPLPTKFFLSLAPHIFPFKSVSN